MRYIAVVEIAFTGNARPTSRGTHAPSSGLLKAAYEASRGGFVALMLPEGADRAVDRELDAIVAANPGVFGVVYKQVSDLSTWEGIDGETLVVASSTRVRAAADAIGVRCVDPDLGLAELQRLAEEATSVTDSRQLSIAQVRLDAARTAHVNRQRMRRTA